MHGCSIAGDNPTQSIGHTHAVAWPPNELEGLGAQLIGHTEDSRVPLKASGHHSLKSFAIAVHEGLLFSVIQNPSELDAARLVHRVALKITGGDLDGVFVVDAKHLAPHRDDDRSAIVLDLVADSRGSPTEGSIGHDIEPARVVRDGTSDGRHEARAEQLEGSAESEGAHDSLSVSTSSNALADDASEEGEGRDEPIVRVQQAQPLGNLHLRIVTEHLDGPLCDRPRALRVGAVSLLGDNESSHHQALIAHPHLLGLHPPSSLTETSEREVEPAEKSGHVPSARRKIVKVTKDVIDVSHHAGNRAAEGCGGTLQALTHALTQENAKRRIVRSEKFGGVLELHLREAAEEV